MTYGEMFLIGYSSIVGVIAIWLVVDHLRKDTKVWRGELCDCLLHKRDKK